MPKVTKAVRVDDFLPYCQGLRFPKTLERHVALFLAKLSNVEDAHTVEYLCREEKAWFECKYENNNTRAAHMTKYRKAIASMSETLSFPTAVTYEQPTENGPIRQHLALKWMNYSSAFHEERQAPTKAKTKTQRQKRVAFTPTPVLERSLPSLSSNDYREIAAALILVTGRRPTEILKTGEFTQLGRYQVEFTGQLKSRGKADAYPIYCLCRSHRIIDAFTRLRRSATIESLQSEDNAAVDSRMNATINQTVRSLFSDVLAPPSGEDQLSAKNLRAVYTNIAYHLFGDRSESIGSFAESYLGHQNVGSAASYEDYYCVDEQGKDVEIGVLRHELAADLKEPRADKRTTIHVDGLLKERFDDFGSGTHEEKMVQLLDAADRVKVLERQLHSSNQRLELARKHIELLKEKQAAATAPAASTTTKAKTTDKAKVESGPAHTPIPDDWCEMSNEMLNGSRIPGSADEKIRRSIEAVQAFNEGLDTEDQWAITPTVLQKLSGSHANRVKDYLSRHPKTAQLLEQYNEGYGYHQNRYRGNPRDAIYWLAIYGEYEW